VIDEVEALAREFRVRFPEERIEELVDPWDGQRAIKPRREVEFIYTCAAGIAGQDRSQ
jgi:hypothetical protein